MLDILENISSVLFYMFGLLFILSISTMIAHKIVFAIKYNSIKKEYELLKKELSSHIAKNTFLIEFSQEAMMLQDNVTNINKRIQEIEGELL